MARRDPIALTLTGLLAELRSPRSREAYEAAWTQYATWCKAQRLDVLKAKPQDVKRYVAHLHESKKRSTVGQALSIIRMVYGALVTDGLLAANPAREVKNPKSDDVLKTPIMSEDQMRALLTLEPETWADHRDKALMSVLFGTSWRRSEVAWMRVEDFEEAHGHIVVHGIVKGHKDLTVGVPPWVVEALGKWRAFAGIASGPLFPRNAGGKTGKTRGSKCCDWCRAHDDPKAMPPFDVWKAVKRAAERADVPAKFVQPHAFRRTNITIEGLRGVSLEQSQEQAGHKSRSTTERYFYGNRAAKNAPGQVLADIAKPINRKENP